MELITLILGNWKAAVQAILIIMLVSTLGYLYISKNNLRAELAETKAFNTQCLTANEQWKAQADAAKAKAEALLKRVNELNAGAAHAAGLHTTYANTILATPIQGEDCKAAKNFFDDYLRRRK